MCSSSFQAAPRPRIARPPEMTSSVGDLLGQHRRIAIRDAGHERAEADRRGLAGQRGEDRPALEHRLGGRAQTRDLVEVVHHGDELEAGGLGRLGLLDDAVEEALRRDVRVAVAGEVETEPGVARGRRSRHPSKDAPIGRMTPYSEQR